MAETMSALLPCPWASTVNIHHDLRTVGMDMRQVMCECGAAGPGVACEDTPQSRVAAEIAARKLWNALAAREEQVRRELDAENAKLRESLERARREEQAAVAHACQLVDEKAALRDENDRLRRRLGMPQ